MNQITRDMLDFIEKSPASFQVVERMRERFEENGFTELKENRKWDLTGNNKFYVTRNHSSFIAFTIPEHFCAYDDRCPSTHNTVPEMCFRIVATHSDSPAFKIKENPEMKAEKMYTKLNVEKYGGMLMNTWFDRPLSIAGRVMIVGHDSDVPCIREVLVNIQKDLLLIPNLAIHMNRNANEGNSYNAQKDMLPLIAMDQHTDAHQTAFRILDYIANDLGIPCSDILAHDLYLYNRMSGTVWGANEEFVSSPRLDDLQCAFGSMEAFLAAEHGDKSKRINHRGEVSACTSNILNIDIHCVLDNEEVGSSTKQGAASTFMKDTMKRIIYGLGYSEEEYMIALANSFMISADNAHAAHPNYPEKADPTNRPLLNQGIVIKYNANQKYCTDSVSAAIFKQLCELEDVPYQVYVNRSDIAGGSTLGNISNTQVPMNTIDIGLPQLAMHSSYETAGVRDVEYLIRVLRRFWD